MPHTVTILQKLPQLLSIIHFQLNRLYPLEFEKLQGQKNYNISQHIFFCAKLTAIILDAWQQKQPPRKTQKITEIIVHRWPS